MTKQNIIAHLYRNSLPIAVFEDEDRRCQLFDEWLSKIHLNSLEIFIELINNPPEYAFQSDLITDSWKGVLHYSLKYLASIYTTQYVELIEPLLSDKKHFMYLISTIPVLDSTKIFLINIASKLDTDELYRLIEHFEDYDNDIAIWLMIEIKRIMINIDLNILDRIDKYLTRKMA